jgi:hypothetical protein
MYASAGIPGSGLYAVQTFHTGAGQHEVRGQLSSIATIGLIVAVGAAIGLLAGVLIDH